jgi:hypothetical protein
MTAQVRLYHATTPEAAAATLRDGFRDSVTPCEPQFGPGVWLADYPYVDENDAAKGHTRIEVTLPREVSTRYAVKMLDPRTHRWTRNGQYLAPAKVVNRYPRRLLDEDCQAARAWPAYAAGTFAAQWPGTGRDWLLADLQGDPLDGRRATWHERAEGRGGVFGLLVSEGQSTWPREGRPDYQPKTYAIVNVGQPLPEQGRGWHLGRFVIQVQPGRRYAQAVRDLRATVAALAAGDLTEGEARENWRRAEASHDAAR